MDIIGREGWGGVGARRLIYQRFCCGLRFAYLRNCGCVLSEKALKEVPSTNCHKVSGHVNFSVTSIL